MCAMCIKWYPTLEYIAFMNIKYSLASVSARNTVADDKCVYESCLVWVHATCIIYMWSCCHANIENLPGAHEAHADKRCTVLHLLTTLIQLLTTPCVICSANTHTVHVIAHVLELWHRLLNAFEHIDFKSVALLFNWNTTVGQIDIVISIVWNCIRVYVTFFNNCINSKNVWKTVGYIVPLECMWKFHNLA